MIGGSEPETTSQQFKSRLSLIIWVNLVPRVLSYPPYGARERETLENAGHVSPRIWEIMSKRFGGGAGKCEICFYRAWTGQCSHETLYLT